MITKESIALHRPEAADAFGNALGNSLAERFSGPATATTGGANSAADDDLSEVVVTAKATGKQSRVRECRVGGSGLLTLHSGRCGHKSFDVELRDRREVFGVAGEQGQLMLQGGSGDKGIT